MSATRRVLIVEDDPAINRLIGLVMTRRGYEVDHAHDGVEALAKVDGGGGYDVMVLDLMLPNLNGIEVLQHLEESPPEGLRGVVVTSATPKTIEGKTFDRARLRAVLHKPFEIVQLLEAVERCFDGD